ncbi:MAG TPA: cadherin-like domain-containing protein, partial [Verrucomicrobiae bacterium]|nr:cadherin-like domain-containing protein [Verrucomicrobiae bacterium]
AGRYKVEVSNGAGMVTSREAILAINTVPTVPTKGGATSKDTPMSISSAKLLQGVTDPDGDPFALDSVASISASGGGIAPAGAGVYTYTPPAGFTGLDTFTFNVRDSRGGIGVGMVEVLVVSGALPTQNQVLMMTTPNGVLVRFAGIPGRNYQVQRSTDLNNWTTLITLPAPPHGILEYEDTMELPAAFYRTASTP